MIILRSTLLSACIVMASTASVFAQPHHDAGDGSVSPTTMPNSTRASSAADSNPNVPGATGDSKVPGDKSTVAGDHRATIQQRTGSDMSGGGGR